LLDFILLKDFNPHGVICCESVGEATQWSDENVEKDRKSEFYVFF